MTFHVNEKRVQAMIEDIAAFTASPGKGTTRLTYSPQHRDALDYLQGRMQEAGLATRIDAVGNLFGRLEGSDPSLAPVLVGSHIDSVPNGGAFDGPAGVVAGIETAFCLRDQGIRPRRPVEFVAMIEEEGGRFGGGLLGSRILTGQVGANTLGGMSDARGITLGQAMEGFGLNLADAPAAVIPKGGIHAFLELHIEQGPVLERTGDAVGIVTSIVALSQFEVRITGSAGHAGTTPMPGRRDALVASAGVIAGLPELCHGIDPRAVVTVGQLEVQPGGANVIPDAATFSIDMRAPDAATVKRIKTAIRARLSLLGDAGFGVNVAELLSVPETPMSDEIRERLIAGAEGCGLAWRDMPSGAGHDAMVLSRIAPVGLIFVPSRGGISHTPEEWTDYDQLARGIEVVFRATKSLAE
ncbi:Zn-dependent hydrolase [Paracoccus sp. 1_MG-2023]|uniref:Zn-dependent hydrolase n=1 Tax=unclassified Paracoccus (in: a-proteobacteria) TaxID=2688777 RepID=UPI001C08EA1C|nr:MULTISPECIES: Zn-dependent hydrolase [unclassified Paracoccus (in: a-proteobacteria)]MBU2957937.1 Zn-dependent hydrolase [Paracoccus sp. C2R09]MDO6668870.1 Zn-dependent hydrolase [Paracoccus sp. 1_MG-2023]